MKQLMLVLLGALLCVPVFGKSEGDRQAARQARSVHLRHQGWGKDAKIFYIEATADRFWPGSYMCLLGFDGGYAGVQEYPNGKHLAIFSVWEVPDGHDYTARAEDVAEEKRTKLLYQGEGVTIARFGGEGTGGQSRIDNYPWELGKPVRMAVSCSPDGEHRTAYTCWIWEEDKGEWFRMATFSTLLGGNKGVLNGPYSFLEDFRRNVESKMHVRTARFTRLWAYVGEMWVPSGHCQFSADGNTLSTIDAGPWAEGGWLATGADTRNVTVPLGKKFPVGGVDEGSAERREALLKAVKAAEAPAPEAEAE